MRWLPSKDKYYITPFEGRNVELKYLDDRNDGMLTTKTCSNCAECSAMVADKRIEVKDLSTNEINCINNGVVSVGGCGFATCSDSDGGRNYGLRGTTTGQTFTGGIHTINDGCIISDSINDSINNGWLRETYCDGNIANFDDYDCSAEGKICQDGACVIPPTPTCGDGIINQESEECDDGNIFNNDDCNNLCKLSQCSVTIGNSIYTLNPCKIEMTMVDRSGNLPFTIILNQEGEQEVYSFNRRTGEGFPDFGIMGLYATGGAIGNFYFDDLYFNDKYLNANADGTSKIYQGYLPILVNEKELRAQIILHVNPS